VTQNVADGVLFSGTAGLVNVVLWHNVADGEYSGIG